MRRLIWLLCFLHHSRGIVRPNVLQSKMVLLLLLLLQLLWLLMLSQSLNYEMELLNVKFYMYLKYTTVISGFVASHWV